MMLIKNIRCLIVILLFSIFQLHSQNSKPENELWKQYNATKGTPNSVLILIQISKLCYQKDNVLSEKIATKAVFDAKKLNDQKILALAELRLAHIYFEKGKYDESYYLADKLLQKGLELHDDFIYADACLIVGKRFHFRGEYPTALEYYLKSLSYFERVDSLKSIAQVTNSIGGIYFNQLDLKNGYLYYRKSQLIQFRLKNNIGIGIGYLNLSAVLIEQKRLTDAKKLLDSSFYYFDLDKYDIGKALIYANLSDIYMLNGKLDSALNYALISYHGFKKSNNLYTLAALATSVSKLYLKTNNYKKALEFVDESINLANKTKQSDNLSASLLLKSEILEKAGRINEALSIYKEYKAYRDTIMNSASIKKQAEDALKYDYNKKDYQQKLEQAERDTKQRFILNSTIIGILLLVIILFLVVRSYRNNQKNSQIIASQKVEVEKQHDLLQEKNKEVLDSITYAKRIQEAILPPIELIKEYLPNSFVLYKPKAIVAGDFYWMEIIENLVFIAAADCTGHGVPGALVSVVCSNALNRTVKEFNLTEPGLILDKTRELVLETFEKSSSDVKDGMDISLLCINTKTKQASWSGANNPLWYIHNNELKEIKGTKQPIGKTDHLKSFLTHQIEYKENTTFYLFTDGFADQFGGINGKKFKYKHFSDLLIANNHKAPSEQSLVIEKTFEDWKGNLEQVDDVCVIGIKI